MTYEALCADLEAEEAALDALVAGLADDAWATKTPADGWDVRDSIGHLALSEDLARLSATDPDAFTTELGRLLEDLDSLADKLVGKARTLAPPEVLAWWREGRSGTLGRVAESRPEGSAALVCRADECDVVRHCSADGDVGARSGRGRRLGCRAGVLAPTAPCGRDRRAHPASHTFGNRGLPEPAEPVYVELTTPDGERWAWGEPGTVDRVTGPVVDFCLVVTQRRNPASTALAVEGPAATRVDRIAQAFAGPPTDHRGV